MALRRYHVIVAEASPPVVTDNGPGQPLEVRPARAALDVMVDIEDTHQGPSAQDEPKPLALQAQVAQALRAAAPSGY